MENMLCITFSPLAVGKKNLGHWMIFFCKKLEMSMFHHWWLNVFKAHFCVRMFWGEHSHRCAVCVGHCLLCEMTLISLLPNLAGSISPAIIGERGREDGGEEGLRGLFMLIIGLPPCTICLCAPEHSCTLTGICRSDVGRLLTLTVNISLAVSCGA